ncbi:MAG: hypothetical protein OXC40_00860, partial [Proteobacteria bacterium]|nr:hypothetical protein [Pseudomonadota bacterium]
IVALFIALAHLNRDRSSLILFADSLLTYVPPMRGEAQLFRILKALLDDPSAHYRQTSLMMSFSDIEKQLQRASLCVVISDFLDDSFGYMKYLQALSHKHELSCLRVRDPLELKPPKSSLFTLQDLESRQIYYPSSGDQMSQGQDAWSSQMTSRGIFAMDMTTTACSLAVIKAMIQQKSLGSRRRLRVK